MSLTLREIRRRFFCQTIRPTAVGLALLAGLLAGPGRARANEPTPKQMQEQLRALQAKVDQMQARQDALDKAATEYSVARVAADARRHDDLLDIDGFSGGWNKDKQQFFLGSEDGSFYFHPGVIFQVRYVANYREGGKASGDSDWTNGFEIRRAKFVFDGNLFSKDLTYKFRWQDSTNGGTPSLDYGYVQYTFFRNAMPDTDLAVRVGQFKDVISKEELVSDGAQLMVERSMANNFVGGITTGPFIQGIDLLTLGKTPIHTELLFFDGNASGNTDFTNNRDITTAPAPRALNYGVAGRIDYKFFGDWADTNDLTGKESGKHDLLDLGAAFDYSDAQGQNNLHWAVDAQYQMARRIVLLAAIYGNDFSFRNTAAGAPTGRGDVAGMIEGGYMLTPAWQLIARYSLVRMDDQFKANDQGTFNEIAAGVNYYMGEDGAWGNHAKVSVDLTYLPNGSPAATGLDYLGTAQDKAEFVLRSQFQLMF